MQSIGCDWRECHHIGSIVHIAADGKYQGHIVISDEAEARFQGRNSALKAIGIEKAVMLTGDIKSAADAMGKEAGIDEIHSQLLSEKSGNSRKAPSLKRQREMPSPLWETG